jgi:hypothetical protein
MDNQTLTRCKNQSLTGGAVPQDNGRLYYGMTAPFVNYSVAGWLWYQVRCRWSACVRACVRACMVVYLRLNLGRVTRTHTYIGYGHLLL